MKQMKGRGEPVGRGARPAARFGAGLAAAALLFAGARAALGQEPPAALFRGGSHHGYDEERVINTTDTRRSRNHGGARDGYTLAALADVKVPGPAGTLILIR